MKINVSKQFRELRLARGVSQYDVAHGVNGSRTTISNFEIHGRKIDFTLLFDYLEYLNVSVEEFSYLMNDMNLSEKKKLSKKMNALCYQNKLDELENLVEFCKLQYNITKDFYYYALYAEYYMSKIIHKSDPEYQKKETEIGEKIKKYLAPITVWGHFEICLFSALLDVFDTETIVSKTKALVPRIMSKNTLENQYQSCNILLGNALFHLFDRQEFNAAKEIFDLYSEELTYKQFEKKLMHTYFSAFFLIHEGYKESGYQKIEQILATFIEYGFDSRADELEKFVHSVFPNECR